jgi:hypothetical protein
MGLRPWLVCAGAAAFLAAQPFEDAYDAGKEAMAHGQWRQAIGALERAVRLHPQSAGSYCPYTLLARCHLELGETVAARGLLHLADAAGEPAWERDPVAERLPRVIPDRPEPLPRAFWIGAGGLAGLGLFLARRRRD